METLRPARQRRALQEATEINTGTRSAAELSDVEQKVVDDYEANALVWRASYLEGLLEQLLREQEMMRKDLYYGID